METPSFITRLRNFATALKDHVLNGMPQCTNEEIQERLTICESCGHYKETNKELRQGICGHGKCGCSLSGNMELLNKLAWADQECPIGRWPKLYNLDNPKSSGI